MRGMMPRISLGSILAFLAPGVLLLIALSFHIPQIADLLTSATSDGSGLGPIAAILLACLSLGVVLNGCRSVLLDWIWYSKKWPKPIQAPADVLGVLASRDQLEVYETMLESMFRFYLFYANVALALLLTGISFLTKPAHENVPIAGTIGLLIVVIIMLAAARNSLSDFSKATHALRDQKVEPGEGRRGRGGMENNQGGAPGMGAAGAAAHNEFDEDLMPSEFPRPPA